MSLGLVEKRNVIKQGKPFVQFLVMSFARDKWDKIAELASCTRRTDTRNPRVLDMSTRGRICVNTFCIPVNFCSMLSGNSTFCLLQEEWLLNDSVCSPGCLGSYLLSSPGDNY